MCRYRGRHRLHKDISVFELYRRDGLCTAVCFFLALSAGLPTLTSTSRGQESGLRPAELVARRFDRTAPQIGDLLPDLTALDTDGNEVPLRNLTGQYTVLTFGCLT